MLEAKIKEKGLVYQSSISDIVKKFDLNTKIAPLVVKSKLLAKQNKIVKF